MGVQSRVSWLFFKGPRSATPSRAGPRKPHNSSVSLCCLLLYHIVPQALKLSTLWQPRYSSRTSSSSLCDGHGRCFCVCVCAMFPVFLGNRSEHTISRPLQSIGCCVAGRYKSTFVRNCKRNRAATAHTTTAAAVQRHYNSSGTKTPALEGLVFATATVLSFLCMQCSVDNAT